MQRKYVFIVYSTSLVFIIRLRAVESSCMTLLLLFDFLQTVALMTLHFFPLHIISISKVPLRSFPLGKPSGLSYGYCYWL